MPSTTRPTPPPPATIEIVFQSGPRDPQKYYYNPDTWSLYINDPQTHSSLHRLAYQSKDLSEFHPTIETRYDCHPWDLPRYRERKVIGRVRAGKVAMVRNEILAIKGRVSGSRGWVKEVLEVLEKRGLIGLEYQANWWLENN